MKKQLRIISKHCPAIEAGSGVTTIPYTYFSRHLRRRPVFYRYRNVVIYTLPGFLFVHRFPSGYRYITGFPF